MQHSGWGGGHTIGGSLKVHLELVNKLSVIRNLLNSLESLPVREFLASESIHNIIDSLELE